jgi:hypothetical protein
MPAAGVGGRHHLDGLCRRWGESLWVRARPPAVAPDGVRAPLLRSAVGDERSASIRRVSIRELMAMLHLPPAYPCGAKGQETRPSQQTPGWIMQALQACEELRPREEPGRRAEWNHVGTSHIAVVAGERYRQTVTTWILATDTTDGGVALSIDFFARPGGHHALCRIGLTGAGFIERGSRSTRAKKRRSETIWYRIPH